MKKSPTIKRVKPLNPYRVRVTWSNGQVATLDLADAITRSRSLSLLRDVALFNKVKPGEWGHSIRWTDDIELGAESLWRRTLAAIGRRDAMQFMDWRMRHSLSLSQAAQELGLSRRMVAYYESGLHKVPKTVLLACEGWEARHDRAA